MPQERARDRPGVITACQLKLELGVLWSCLQKCRGAGQVRARAPCRISQACYQLLALRRKASHCCLPSHSYGALGTPKLSLAWPSLSVGPREESRLCTKGALWLQLKVRPQGKAGINPFHPSCSPWVFRPMPKTEKGTGAKPLGLSSSTSISSEAPARRGLIPWGLGPKPFSSWRLEQSMAS